MLGYPFEGILGRLVAAGLPFFIFTPKKGTNNQLRERVVISTKYFRAAVYRPFILTGV